MLQWKTRCWQNMKLLRQPLQNMLVFTCCHLRVAICEVSHLCIFLKLSQIPNTTAVLKGCVLKFNCLLSNMSGVSFDFGATDSCIKEKTWLFSARDFNCIAERLVKLIHYKEVCLQPFYEIMWHNAVPVSLGLRNRNKKYIWAVFQI